MDSVDICAADDRVNSARARIRAAHLSGRQPSPEEREEFALAVAEFGKVIDAAEELYKEQKAQAFTVTRLRGTWKKSHHSPWTESRRKKFEQMKEGIQ